MSDNARPARTTIPGIPMAHLRRDTYINSVKFSGVWVSSMQLWCSSSCFFAMNIPACRLTGFLRRTGTRLGKSTVWLLSALGLLALAPLRGTIRAAFSSSSSSPPRNRSTRKKTANQAILPTNVDPSPSQVDGVLTTLSTGDEDGAGAAAGVGGAAPGGLRENDSPSFSGGGLGEGAARDGRPRCWTDEEGKSRCLPTVFFLGVSKCGEIPKKVLSQAGPFPCCHAGPTVACCRASRW